MAISEKVRINEEYITLGQFLKIVDLVQSGGEAKSFLLYKDILINNEKDNRRGRKLRKGDLINIEGKVYEIC